MALIVAAAPIERAKASFLSAMSTAITLAPSGVGDHDRRQPDAAAAVHGDPLPRRDLALVDDGPEGGGEPAAQAGGRGEVHLSGRRARLKSA